MGMNITFALCALFTLWTSSTPHIMFTLWPFHIMGLAHTKDHICTMGLVCTMGDVCTISHGSCSHHGSSLHHWPCSHDVSYSHSWPCSHHIHTMSDVSTICLVHAMGHVYTMGNVCMICHVCIMGHTPPPLDPHHLINPHPQNPITFFTLLNVPSTSKHDNARAWKQHENSVSVSSLPWMQKVQMTSIMMNSLWVSPANKHSTTLTKLENTNHTKAFEPNDFPKIRIKNLKSITKLWKWLNSQSSR